jgi:hypothetical protein
MRRKNPTLALRRFRLAYLLKGSVFTVDDLVPPSAPTSRKRQKRRVRRSRPLPVRCDDTG